MASVPGIDIAGHTFLQHPESDSADVLKSAEKSAENLRWISKSRINISFYGKGRVPKRSSCSTVDLMQIECRNK